MQNSPPPSPSGEDAAKLAEVLAHPRFEELLRRTPSNAAPTRGRSLLPAAAVTFLTIALTVQVASQRERWSISFACSGLGLCALAWRQRRRSGAPPVERHAALLQEQGEHSDRVRLGLANGKSLELAVGDAELAQAPLGSAGVAYVQGDRLLSFEALGE